MPLVTRKTDFKDKRLDTITNVSATDTALTVSSPATGPVRRLLKIAVNYSATPVQAGVTVVLNSGVDAAFDELLATGTANAKNTVYIPDERLLIDPADALDVIAPAGGGVITSAITISLEIV